MKIHLPLITFILFTPFALLSAWPDFGKWNRDRRSQRIKQIDKRATAALASISMSSLEKLNALPGGKYWPKRKEIIRDLIDNQQVDVNTILYLYSQTSLDDSVIHGDADFIKYLLQQNADVTRTNWRGETPLIHAIDSLKSIYRDVIPISYNKIIKMLIFAHPHHLTLENIIQKTYLDERHLRTKDLIMRTLAKKETWYDLTSEHISFNLASIVAGYCYHDLLTTEDIIEPKKNTVSIQLEKVEHE